MLRKLLFYVLILVVQFLTLSSFAQSETPEDVVVGGEAKCIVIGNSPIKSGVTDGNRLVILESEGFANGSIILQRFVETNEIKIDVNALALFGLIDDLEGFLGGKILKFNNTDSELSLVKEIKNKSTEIEVTNLLKDGTRGNVSGKVQLKGISNDLVTGQIYFTVGKTLLKTTKSENTEVKDNGQIKIKCKFRDVPFVRKPAPSL